jgi:membrane-bound ClpP family serine protease
MKATVSRAIEGLINSPFGLFKGFVVAVLLQFSILSCIGIVFDGAFSALPMLDAVVNSASYWWSFISMLGAMFILFDHTIKNHVALVVCGYSAAIVSFIVLGYDFILRKPPIYTAAVLSITAATILGGTFYERIRRTT